MIQSRPMDRVSLECNNDSRSEALVIDITIIWDLDDDPDGNVQRIAEHAGQAAVHTEYLHAGRTSPGTSAMLIAAGCDA